jgi:hypothetical protein
LGTVLDLELEVGRLGGVPTLARPETCTAEKKDERWRVVSSSHRQSARHLVISGCGTCGKAEKKGRGSRRGSGLALHTMKEKRGGGVPGQAGGLEGLIFSFS